MKEVLVIVGPTASGKSALAIRYAKKYGGEVISADSRQIYRGMNIGTGKVTKKEMQGVPHHLLSVADPRKQYSVEQYKKDATRVLMDILARRRMPIICGGTGLYVDALVHGIILPQVPPNKVLRKKLAKMSAEKLFTLLQKKDPARAKTIDAKNPRRLIRALEIVDTLGSVPPQKTEKPIGLTYVWIGVDLSDATLKKKIHTRLMKRMRKGMVTEVKKLHCSPAGGGLSWKRLKSFGLEYKWLALYLEGKVEKKDMLEKLELDIWHYAKRQRTWFKRNKNIKWI